MLIHVACDNDLHPPVFGATQRLFGLARGMASRHDVRALCVVPNRGTGTREERIAGVTIRREKAWHTSLFWRLERLGIAPLFAAEAGHRANARRYLAALGGVPDVLQCDLALTGLLEHSAARLRAYHAHNVETTRFAAGGERLARSPHWREQLRRLERRAVEQAAVTVVCTDEDAEAMRALHGAREVEVVANGYDETALHAATAQERARAREALGLAGGDYVAAFVGGDWRPNHEALRWLLERVMPALAGDGIKLLVVGGVAGALAGRREPWLVARGATPDLGEVLAAADAGLNPVTSGGGSNVKVPTYLAAGLAVITTPFGLRGYAPLEAHVVSAPAEAFADALRARPRGWHARGESAPAALSAYGWGTLGARLGESYERRLAGAPAAAAAKGAA